LYLLCTEHWSHEHAKYNGSSEGLLLSCKISCEEVFQNDHRSVALFGTRLDSQYKQLQEFDVSLTDLRDVLMFQAPEDFLRTG
jgi:hypothetical protein